jgi:phage baseplate assembly protein W
LQKTAIFGNRLKKQINSIKHHGKKFGKRANKYGYGCTIPQLIDNKNYKSWFG